LHVVEIDDEELYALDDVLGEASAARYQMLPKNAWMKTSGWKKDSERKTMSESEVKW
jgi:hypothetical protein